ncbi:MAG TPA: PilX N-terminal domain-containing pilus assembly protein [Dongiaceae bacterium]|nr:PilX N-terminal domain-containing pilus assembly protein [Dongiaceae bacterium]
MKTQTQHDRRRQRRGKKNKQERGAALVISLLLLLLLTGMTVAMVLSSSSDMLINGYYRNFRGSFYAADSGLTIARQAMVNNVLAAVPSSFSTSTQPIPTGTESSVVTAINAAYGASYQSLNAGQAASSWPEKYKLDTSKTTLTLASCQVLGGAGTCTAPTGTVTGYKYVYNYTLTALGQSSGTEVATVDDSGSFTFNATLAASGGTTTSFAGYGMFIDQYSACSADLVAGTITGPVFTNGAWTFGTGNYIFTDTVGSVSGTAGYDFGGSTGCQAVAGTSASVTVGKTKTTIAPTFQNGFNLGQNSVPLPVNDYSQKRAVLDGMGTNTANVTNSDMNAALKNASGASYPTGGASTGVYLPYSVDSSTGIATYNGGGIYVQGDAAVTLTQSGNNQVYTIVQGSTTTTVTVNVAANSTTITSGGNTKNIVGVPSQRDPSTGAITRDATLLYVNGSITALQGGGQGVASINDATALTITAANNVTITGDILYNHQPVTKTQDQIPGTPPDTLIPGNDYGQVLGIFTASGDIQLNNKQSNGNLEIDASIATISQGGSGGLVNTGNSINTLQIVGGRIQNQIKNIGATTRNVYFDRRFASNGFAPPWFPSTTITSSGTSSATMVTTVQRTKWFNRTTY